MQCDVALNLLGSWLDCHQAVQLENLLDLALKGALIDQIKHREEQFLELRAELESSILDTEKKLSRLPTQDELEKDAECLKLKL